MKARHVMAMAVVVGLAAVLVKAATSRGDLQTVKHVDLPRYLGRWYEIARYPNRFEKKCAGDVTADYSLLANGRIRVVNSCVEGNSHVDSARGTAKIVDSTTNAKLKVAFFWPFYGNYWILELGESQDQPGGRYEYAVVGEPSRRYLWILSRSPHMSDALYQELLARVAAHGYDPGKLVRTRQLPTN